MTPFGGFTTFREEGVVDWICTVSFGLKAILRVKEQPTVKQREMITLFCCELAALDVGHGTFGSIASDEDVLWTSLS